MHQEGEKIKNNTRNDFVSRACLIMNSHPFEAPPIFQSSPPRHDEVQSKKGGSEIVLEARSVFSRYRCILYDYHETWNVIG